MKKNKHIFLFLLLFIITLGVNGHTTGHSEQLYYYTFNNKVYIEAVSGRLMLKKQQNIEKEEFENLVKNRLGEVKFDWFNSDICTVFTNNAFVDDAIAQMLIEDAIVSARPVYMISSDLEYFSKHHIQEEPMTLGHIDQVVLKYKDGVDKATRDEIQKTFGLTRISGNELFELYSVSKNVDILSLSNTLFETGHFEFAYPELISRVTPCDYVVYPRDPYFQYQVTLHNTGQTYNGHTGTPDADIDAPEAWGLTMGSEEIIVAVIDWGVTADHPDLPNTRQVRLNGSNFGTGNPNDPSPVGNDNHGNACAGVIAATANNGEGVAGIAPLCKIMPVRIDNTTQPADVANAIKFAVDNGAKIISNSWGYDSQCSDPNGAILAAISYAINHNVLVVFAAGNSAKHAINVEGYVDYPANQNISGMLTVGASDRYDHQSDYSPTSSYIDIVAPSNRASPYGDSYYYPFTEDEKSDMWTIDIPDSIGHNPWPSGQNLEFNPGETLPYYGINYLAYTGHFGGTSHSCAVVAGVAALVLSMNPNLTPQTVCDVLTSKAEKVGGYSYNEYGKCDEMGYGRVNAKGAVWMVCDTTYYENQDLYNNVQTVTGCDIYMKDDFIYDAILRVRHRNSVTIDGEFYIDNSVLDIRHY